MVGESRPYIDLVTTWIRSNQRMEARSISYGVQVYFHGRAYHISRGSHNTYNSGVSQDEAIVLNALTTGVSAKYT